MTETQNSAREIAALYETILARKTADPADSYSAQLLADLPRAARKLGALRSSPAGAVVGRTHHPLHAAGAAATWSGEGPCLIGPV